uniref:Ty3 transposon capsid-like protein domain-containing protein n=1 Tax=Populus alba TaxID=43335 RepID=A0A4U5QDD7_POPAL|nr:hypothetical protein D5086_0000106910 [Populus alba]
MNPSRSIEPKIPSRSGRAEHKPATIAQFQLKDCNTDCTHSTAFENTLKPVLQHPIQIGSLLVSPVTTGIRANNPRISIMPPETRSTDLKRIEESLAAVSQDHAQKYELLIDMFKGQSLKLDQTIENQGGQIHDIRNMMGTMAQQLEFTLQKLSQATGSSSSNRERPQLHPDRVEMRNKEIKEDKAATYKDPLEELMELKQSGDLEEYIQDFDILWNKAEVNEKQALVIFLGGIDLEIKNTVKMFEPKTLKHAYNLSRLQANTLTHRKSPSYIRKVTSLYTNPTVSNPLIQPIQTTKNPVNSQTNVSKPQPASWTAHSNHSNYSNPSRPTKFIKNQEFEDRRLKGLCFWCDDKFVPGHRCRNKKVYSLSVLEEEEGLPEDEVIEEEVSSREVTPHISLDALEGTVGLNTMKVNGKMVKTNVCILIDSGSTHNFLNTTIVNKLQFQLTPIKPMTVQAANGDKMVCKFMCKGLRWKMQGISFQADVFIIDLSNCEMVLGIQWLSLLGDILCNYKHLWMSFDWQGQRVLLKGENPPKFQSIELKQLSALVKNHPPGEDYLLYSLQFMELEENCKYPKPQFQAFENTLKPVLQHPIQIGSLLVSPVTQLPSCQEGLHLPSLISS